MSLRFIFGGRGDVVVGSRYGFGALLLTVQIEASSVMLVEAMSVVLMEATSVWCLL